MKPTVADHVARFLVQRGVEQVFGLCGHTNISVLAAFERLGAPRFTTTHHEQVAAHAADGLARTTGRPGVLLLHVGPGMTNATTGVATAAFDSVPLLVLAGDVPSYFEGRGPHQEFNLRRDADQVSVYEPFVKRAWRVRRSDQVPRILARAWDTALAGRPGPVLVSLPMDVLTEVLEVDVIPASPVARPALAQEMAMAIAGELRAAARPVVLAGGGTRQAAGAVRRLAELAGVPVIHTLMGTGILPPGHPQLLGMIGFWGSPAANRLASEADVVLAVGTRFPETDSSSWQPGVTFRIPPARLIHVDLDPHEPGRNYPTAIAATADAALALEAITTAYGGRHAGPRLRLERTSRRARSVPRGQPHQRDIGRGPAAAGAHPGGPPTGRPGRHPGDRRGLEQERRRAAVSGRQPRFVPHPRRLLDDGFRPCRGPGRRGCRYWSAGHRPGRGRRLRIQPERRRDGRRDGHRARVGGDEQRGIRDDRGAGAEALRVGLWLRVRGRWSPLFTDFAALARAYGADGVRIERPDQLQQALRDACDSGRPTVIDVPMRNTPVMTPGEWDIERIYQVAR